MVKIYLRSRIIGEFEKLSIGGSLNKVPLDLVFIKSSGLFFVIIHNSVFAYKQVFLFKN